MIFEIAYCVLMNFMQVTVNAPVQRKEIILLAVPLLYSEKKVAKKVQLVRWNIF